MASLNRFIGMGNITRDLELRYTGSGMAVLAIGLAVNNSVKDGDKWKNEPCFLDVTAFGKTAERCSEYLQKGSKVIVDGRLKMETWEKDGQRRSKIAVIADQVHFLDKNGGESGGKQDAAEEQKGSESKDAGTEDCPF